MLFPVCYLFSLDVVALTGNRFVPSPALSPAEGVCTGNIPPSRERDLVPLVRSSPRASLQGCGTGTSSLRTWEKSLVLLLPGPDCGFGKPWLGEAGELEKANMQVLGEKRNLCCSLYEEDVLLTRNRLMAPLDLNTLWVASLD